ncbi:unnamed protein product [Durusdinium trenchii]|uniref:NYN domain-containing protein n=1 Tax=Durusdinium trenchii TaxID=1381693 RepID=A0ABP0QTX5_9DINO
MLWVVGFLWILEVGIFTQSKTTMNPGRTELLVDADAHSIQDIQQAIHILAERGRVHTTVFGPPGREASKKWGRLINEADVKFQPVCRLTDPSLEPNDAAIASVMQGLSTCPGVDLIAVLTSDCDCNRTILELKGLEGTKPSFVVLVPEYKPFVAACDIRRVGWKC